jgi:hypothetical protein
MKTFKIIHQSSPESHGIVLRVGIAGKLMQNLLVIIMFFSLTLLPSCFAVLRTPGYDRHEVRNERHDRDDHHDHDEHHDNDEHHN